MESDSDIAASASEAEAEAEAAAAVPRLPAASRIQTAGAFFLLLFVSVGLGIWKQCGAAGTSLDDAIRKYPFNHGIALGLCQWQLLKSDSDVIPGPL